MKKNIENRSLMNFLFGGSNEKRSGTYHPSTFPPQWVSFSNHAKSGVPVNEDSCKGIAAVYSCVKVLSESVASLPLPLYRRLPGGGKERATNHPLYKILHLKPNRFMTSVEWREMMMGHLCLRGNAYNQILRDQANRVIELIPLNPVYMKPYIDGSQELRYKYTPFNGKERDFPKNEILHIKGLSSDGLVGESPISVAREVFGIALATQLHGAKSYSNGASIRGVLEMTGHIEDDEKFEEIRKQWSELYEGPENTAKTAILEDGLTWKAISMSLRDAQYVEMFKLNIEEVARIFTMPPHKIGHLEHATFSNIEWQGLAYVTDTLLPWVRRFEQAIQVSVLEESEEYFVEFLFDGLLRGDAQSRNNAYSVAVTNGWMTRNEVRKLENMNPEKGLDDFLVPLNMGKASDNSIDDNKEDDKNTEEQKNSRKLEVLMPILRHEAGRLIRRRLKSITNKNFNTEKEIEILKQSLEPCVSAAVRLMGLDIAQGRIDSILSTISERWDDATNETEIEAVKISNYKLIINSLLFEK